MRLIDADAIRYDQLLKIGNKEHPLEWAVSRPLINSMPTIEAEPTKHGRWIWDKENDKMYCSECGYETDNWGVHQESDPIEWQLPNYCENCGAKMDEVGE